MKEYLFYQDNKKHIDQIWDSKKKVSKVVSFMSEETAHTARSSRSADKFSSSIENLKNFQRRSSMTPVKPKTEMIKKS